MWWMVTVRLGSTSAPKALLRAHSNSDFPSTVLLEYGGYSWSICPRNSFSPFCTASRVMPPASPVSITRPSTSYVSVEKPKRISSTYSLDSLRYASRRLLAEPTRHSITPSAISVRITTNGHYVQKSLYRKLQRRAGLLSGGPGPTELYFFHHALGGRARGLCRVSRVGVGARRTVPV